jgi:hypothetical protein
MPDKETRMRTRESTPILIARYTLIAAACVMATPYLAWIAIGAICDLLEAMKPGRSISQQWLRSDP